MKQILFLIVAASLYLHFYPNEEVTQFYNKQKQVLLSGFNDIADTKVQLKSEKIYQDMESKLSTFTDREVEHLKQITSSRDNVNAFHLSICKTNKRDIVFHITNEKAVCATINKYASLL